MILPPINLQKWIAENQELLKPPVGNKVLVKSNDFIIMAVGGPNARTDFHYNQSDEFFFQITGDINLDIQQEGKLISIPIKEGELFLLPSKTPHRPVRGEGTVGLVIESVRKEGDIDGLMWFCEKCNSLLYEEYFKLTSIENDFLPVFRRFNASESFRTCSSCAHVQKADNKHLNS